MRPGPEFVAMIHAAGAAPTAAPVHGLINGTAAAAAHSPWQSPVPYLFGGLAAMLGLIAFALLILACSYWKLSGYLDAPSDGARDGDSADGEKGSASGAARPAADFLEHVVVIMAGEERPTFLAKPATSRAAVEVELAATALSTSGGDGQEKKMDECEVSSTQLGADAASQSHGDHHDAASRSLQDDAASQSHGDHHDAASRSLQDDAASQSHGDHHDAASRSLEEDAASQSLEEDAASQSHGDHHDAASPSMEDDAASPSMEDDAASRSLEEDAATQSRGHQHHQRHEYEDESSSTTAVQESSQ